MTLSKKFRDLYCWLLATGYWFSSCAHIDLYEKVLPLPKHQWQSNYKPEFSFAVKDTNVSYQLSFIVRHNNQYKYNNVWVNLYAKGPAGPAQSFKLELPLASKEGWLGSGMDDVFEHRIGFALDPGKFAFDKAGTYTFALEQIMRDDPLNDVMDVGLRLEKKPQ